MTTMRRRAHRGVVVIYYADDGQTIPQPGLVRLGTIDTGLEVIAAAGNDFQLTIEPLD
jgi:hypothetical protein